jgi:hypothetical protein
MTTMTRRKVSDPILLAFAMLVLARSNEVMPAATREALNGAALRLAMGEGVPADEISNAAYGYFVTRDN